MKHLLRRWRAFWQSIPNRVYGSHIPDSPDGITRLSSRAVFSGDDVLLMRLARAREQLGEAPAQRRLIQDQPDYGERQPVDYERLPS